MMEWIVAMKAGNRFVAIAEFREYEDAEEYRKQRIKREVNPRVARSQWVLVKK